MDEDAVLLALGNLQGEMKGIGREIGEVKDLLKCKTADCSECRKELDDQNTAITQKISEIEREHTGEKAVETWWDSYLVKIGIVIGASCGIIGLILRLQ